MKYKTIKIIISLIYFLLLQEAYAKDVFDTHEPQYKKKIMHSKSFLIQIDKIKKSSPSLYLKNQFIYKAISNWLKSSSKINELSKFGIRLFQMKGIDNYGNVKITGYYTPIIQARKIRQGNFKYPIYSMPNRINKNVTLPKRKDIYNGVLNNKYILAYSNSLLNNFIMEIQGSGFIDYGNNKKLTYFSYAGKNGWPYRAIGEILIHRGDIKKKNMSMQAIKLWCKKHSEREIKSLFEKNESFVFFKETHQKEVCGASSVPLISKASIAVDKSIIKSGSVILLKIPLLNTRGFSTNQYEHRLVIALDVGGAIKNQHFDVYEGVGKKASISAGFYNHYGYAWILKKK